jgi:hypothetical protein
MSLCRVDLPAERLEIDRESPEKCPGISAAVKWSMRKIKAKTGKLRLNPEIVRLLTPTDLTEVAGGLRFTSSSCTDILFPQPQPQPGPWTTSSFCGEN